MKKFLMRFFGIIGIIAAILLVSYPLVSDYLMSLNNSGEVVANEQAVSNASESELSEELQAAIEYNENLNKRTMLADPFAQANSKDVDIQYESLLNLAGDGVMGSIKIPSINVDLPIFHGVSDEALKKGAGHMRGTSLPVGGTGTHTVLAGHTGFSSARLFSDLNTLEEGDVFFIYTLDQKMAYQVDDIKIVPPGKTEQLQIVDGKDYATLVTCTPFGVNDHRLLVRGERIDYNEAEDIAQARGSNAGKSTWFREYLKALIAGIIIFALIIVLFVVIRHFINRKAKKKALQDEEDNADDNS